MDDDRLAAELRVLGTSLDVAAPDAAAVATAVLDRLADEDLRVGASATRIRATVARYRVRVVAAAVALLIALGLTPPVRAVVAEWFGFGGVVVRPGPSEQSASPPLPVESGLTLAAARDLVEFEPVVPEALGEPDGVEVSADRRMLTLTWGDGDDTVRLDQFDGRLSALFLKTAVIEETAERLEVGVDEAWWFSEPHRLVVLDDGRERTESARVAEPTLVWRSGEVTLRLEGLGRERAVEVAESVAGIGTG